MNGSSLEWLDSTPLLVKSVIVLGLMTVAFVGGGQIRIWFLQHRRQEQSGVRDYEGYIVSSVLGLLAILLGFTFSLSIGRYEERRELLISQSNAIETIYLRAQFLGAPHRERLRRLLIAYNDNLIEIMSADPPRLPALLEKDSAFLTQIWAATVAAGDTVRTAPLFLALANPVNELIDLDASRRDLRVTRLPNAVFAILLIYHIGAAAVLGYVLAAGAGRFAGAFVLVLMSLALLLIIDIDRPASGLTRQDPFPLLQAGESMQRQPSAEFDRWRK